MNKNKIICSIKFEEEVLCQICNYTHPTTIQNHIRFKHPEISIHDYMIKYGAEITSEKLKIKRAEKSAVKKGPMSDEQKFLRSVKNKEFWEYADDMKEKVSDRMKKAAVNGTHPSQTLEYKEMARKSAIKRNKTDKQKEAVKAALTGIKLPKERVERSAAGHRGIPLSEETKKKISLVHRKAFAAGIRVPTHAKIRGYYNKKDGNKIPYMSNLELIYFKKLDEENKDWEYETIRISYILNGIERTYFPDILVRSDNELLEIKSKYFWYYHKEMCEVKAIAARKYCQENGLTYKILYEDDLGIKYTGPDYIKNYNFPKN